jgi:O-antigen ligase
MKSTPSIHQNTAPTSSAYWQISIAFFIALTGPALVAYTAGPSTTVANQLMAIGGWGLVILISRKSRMVRQPQGGNYWIPVMPTFVVLGILSLQALVAPLRGLPVSLSLQALCVLAAATTTVMAGFSAEKGRAVGRADIFSSAMVLAGLASALIACVQVLVPSWSATYLASPSPLAGRAVGNFGQPNHLSSLLILALIAMVPLAQSGRWFKWRVHTAWYATLSFFLIFAVVLTASRTGLLGLFLLATWGLADKRLSHPVRFGLLASPLIYAFCWALMSAWSSETSSAFGGALRLSEKDLSASRFGIWHNAISMILDNPWTGVGWGEFNFAWTLSPFPDRPPAFFDHAHNLPLHLAVELGLPLAALICGLLIWTLWKAALHAWHSHGLSGIESRAAFVMVLMMAVHSFLEYPLWYSYFLLPTAWALGVSLQPSVSKLPIVDKSKTSLPLIKAAGVLMILGAFFAFKDYTKMAAIYTNDGRGLSLGERIVRAQTSIFFRHHADYGIATITEPPSQAIYSFASPTHTLLDTRIMIAWARALNEIGQEDKSRYLAERLREFNNPDSDAFFSVCKNSTASSDQQPLQCQPSLQPHQWREFLLVH